jgi:hypothetical protein
MRTWHFSINIHTVLLMTYSHEMLNLPPLQSGLLYSEQTQPDGSVNFLDANLHRQPNGFLRMSVFDKTTDYPFPVIKYSHFDSNSPTHQSSGIFQGQLVRFRHICNSMRDFKVAVTLLTLLFCSMLLYAFPGSNLDS